MFLQCFAWVAVEQHWRETAQRQGPLWQSQTGAFSHLKVGAVGEKRYLSCTLLLILLSGLLTSLSPSSSDS